MKLVCTPPHSCMVPGCMVAARLFQTVSRRVLLGNRACGIRISRKLEPLRGHQSKVCRANKNSPPTLPFGGCLPIRSRDTIEGKPNERTIRMLLENKNAIIYGTGGSIGGAVAREFAREGARVFLAGRTRRGCGLRGGQHRHLLQSSDARGRAGYPSDRDDGGRSLACRG